MTFIISPHIDDAVLSLGGLIINTVANQNPLTVVNVFTISDWVNPTSIQASNGSQFEKNVDVITALRKLEEKNISEKLKYTTMYWDFLDNPLRGEIRDDLN